MFNFVNIFDVRQMVKLVEAGQTVELLVLVDLNYPDDLVLSETPITDLVQAESIQIKDLGKPYGICTQRTNKTMTKPFFEAVSWQWHNAVDYVRCRE